MSIEISAVLYHHARVLVLYLCMNVKWTASLQLDLIFSIVITMMPRPSPPCVEIFCQLQVHNIAGRLDSYTYTSSTLSETKMDTRLIFRAKGIGYIDHRV